MDLQLLILVFVLLFAGAVYVRQIVQFIQGLPKITPGSNSRPFSVVVLVPARNEESRIGKCITSLLRQDYPEDQYKVIVIDDQSTDRTAETVRTLAQQYPGRVSLLSVLQRHERVSPKINALRYGIRESKSDLIFTTDADCELPPQWISSSVKLFEDNVGVVTGVTLFRNDTGTPRSLFGIQFLDFLSQTACAAGAIGNDKVNNCNGSNMAFRRSVYESIGGYDSLDHLNSGDDSLLAQKIAGTGRWKVRFNLDRLSYVVTTPVSTWKEFLHQRMRWAAQTASYRRDTLFFLICSFVYYLALSITLAGSFFHAAFLVLFLTAFIPKLFVDFLILKKFTSLSCTKFLMRYYPSAALIHIPVVLIAVLGGYFGRFDWKGRVTERRSTS